MYTFNELREKISIAEIAEELGYWKNSKPGARHLEYCLGQSNNAVDEIVIYNSSINEKNTYFSRKSGIGDQGNLINFVANRLDKFVCSKSGMAGVNEVLNKYLGSELKINRPTQTSTINHKDTHFNINYWNPRPLEKRDNEYLTVRRKLSQKTIEDFRSKYHIYLVGKSNHIGFPFRKPGQMDITNFEMRNYFPNDNVNYKAFCTGGDKSESCWIGNFVPYDKVTDVYLFESAIDAMSFYEIKGFSNNTTSAFISTGGYVTAGQINKLKSVFPSAKSWHCCFDNDAAGNGFDISTAYALKGESCKVYARPEASGQTNKIIHLSHENGRTESFSEEGFSSQKYLEENDLRNIEIIKPSKGKDWNEQLVNSKRFDLNLLPTAKINQYIDLAVSQLNLRGYHQLAELIEADKPNIIDCLSQSNSSNYKRENVNVTTAGSKTLTCDISISQVNGKMASNFENLRISDKSTGLTEPFNSGNITISREHADTVKKLLSGSKVQTSSNGITQMLGLSKTPLGWGITIGKQVFNSTDSSAGIG